MHPHTPQEAAPTRRGLKGADRESCLLRFLRPTWLAPASAGAGTGGVGGERAALAAEWAGSEEDLAARERVYRKYCHRALQASF